MTREGRAPAGASAAGRADPVQWAERPLNSRPRSFAVRGRSFCGIGHGPLQQLRHHRHRDHLGLLARDAGQADRADQARDACGRDAALPEPVLEARALGWLPIRPSKPKSPRCRMAWVMRQVQVVAVREHQVERPRRRQRHLGLHRLDADAFDVRRQRAGAEIALAFVDPLHAAVDAGQQAHDGAADMAGAVELQV